MAGPTSNSTSTLMKVADGQSVERGSAVTSTERVVGRNVCTPGGRPVRDRHIDGNPVDREYGYAVGRRLDFT